MTETTIMQTTETEAKIIQLLADAMLKDVERIKRLQDIKFAPITLVLTGAASAAALIGAGVALTKWITG